MDTSSDSSRDSQELRVSPTVSKEKWFIHARTKLQKGYVLIVGKERRVANFYKPAIGYEPCPYPTAKRLVQLGVIVEKGEHDLGTIYTLSPEALPPEPPPKPRYEEPDDEEPDDDLDNILDQLKTDEDEDEDVDADDSVEDEDDLDEDVEEDLDDEDEIF